MKGITVTKEQQEEIDRARQGGLTANEIIEFLYTSTGYSGRHIVDMTSEQIVMAWHRLAEIEPEPVEFWEAMKALTVEEKPVYVVRKGRKFSFRPNHLLSIGQQLAYHGKWYIEEGSE